MRVFDRVVLTPHMRGGTIVNWWLDDRFDTPGPYTFFLEWAESPDADFIEVAGPATDGVLTDSEQRRFSKLPHSVYRVRLETPTTTHYSDVHQVMGDWNRHDWLLGRDIIRREYLRLVRYVGSKGLYLARKQWGEICDACTDFSTGMITNAKCANCFGTGFVGGYHPASVFWMGEDNYQVRAQREDQVGVRSDQVQTARAVACPFLTAKDVWVHSGTGERWSIESKQELAGLRGKPLVYGVELRLVEPDSIIYDVPLTGGSSSSA